MIESGSRAETSPVTGGRELEAWVRKLADELGWIAQHFGDARTSDDPKAALSRVMTEIDLKLDQIWRGYIDGIAHRAYPIASRRRGLNAYRRSREAGRMLRFRRITKDATYQLQELRIRAEREMSAPTRTVVEP